MTPDQIIFILTAALIIGSALMVVTTRNLIHAALWLVVALFGVAVLYAVLDAGFFVVVQVVVYIGAIAILFIFAVMLTRREMRDRGPQLRENWWLAALLGMLVFSGLAFLLINQADINRSAAVIPEGLDTLGALGAALVSPDAYVLPFEVASILLLAALIGAVYLAANRK
ncbi:MAG: NADH-quinone oxidoreductase subunit J [Anaerolineales bacterium]|nr:NADH-quinone oxidoreductase subunit J [Anaerolineales bacterium]